MSALLDLQIRFSQSLIDNHEAIEPLLTETERPAFTIYKQAYHMRFQETLTDDYPALAQLLGNEDFTILVSKYNVEYPSKSYSLRTYGQRLASFLELDPFYSQYPYLSELAAFEWQLTDIFDLADTSVAMITDMNTVPVKAWPTLSVKLHASIRKLDLIWNINEIYPALKAKATMPDLIKESSQKHYLIWRQNYSPHYRLMDSHEWRALKTLEANNFSELCQQLSDLSNTPENAPLEAATFLKSWLAAGLIESVQYYVQEDNYNEHKK